MGWIDKLKQRWGLDTTWRVIAVLIVFSLTGFTVLLIKRPVLRLIDPEIQTSVGFSILYYILIFPFYYLILMGYGFLFGQYRFFKEFSQKGFRRIQGAFSRRDRSK